jgi:hypothetical protein
MLRLTWPRGARHSWPVQTLQTLQTLQTVWIDTWVDAWQVERVCALVCAGPDPTPFGGIRDIAGHLRIYAQRNVGDGRASSKARAPTCRADNITVCITEA